MTEGSVKKTIRIIYIICFIFAVFMLGRQNLRLFQFNYQENLRLYQLDSARVRNINATRKSVTTRRLITYSRTLSVEDVTQLIPHADVNSADADGRTPLMSIARNNPSPDVLRLLIENGADVNAVDNIGRTVLRWAVTDGRPFLNNLRVLIEYGADANVPCNDGITPLMFSAMNSSNPDVIRALIEYGADINAAHNTGWTPLMAAALINPNLDILRALIDKGADVNAVADDGLTPLMRAAWAGPNHAYVLPTIAVKGIPSPILNRTTHLTRASDLDVLLILLESGADVNATDNEGRTALIRTAMTDLYLYPGVLQIFVRKGADVNAADNTGRTLLMWAAERSSNPDDMRILIENGANINAVDYTGRTALMWAAERNYNPNVLLALIDNGADVGIKDNEGKRAINHAEGNERLAQALVYNLRGARIGGGVNLNIYHPWNTSARLPRLDPPASFRISGDFPRLDGATSAYPLYAAIANEIFAVSDKAELQQYLFCFRAEGAYIRLIRGEVDLIFAPHPSDEQLELARNAGVELHFTPIARDGFVFFVNSQNPVSNLSIREIQDIYLRRITNWQGVGGDDRVILPFQRPTNTDIQTTMINEVMMGKEPPQPPMVSHRIDLIGMIYDVAAYQDQEESIGYSFRFFVEEMMRDVLKLNLTPAGERQRMFDILSPFRLLSVNGIAPTAENIRDGTYPLTVEVFAVTAGTTNPHVQDLIDWMLSPQGQKLIEKTGFIGVKANRN